jgi:hypothetical protein
MAGKKPTTVQNVIIAISIIAGFLVVGWGFEDRIAKRVLIELRDPEMLREIASLVRPSLIFDHNGAIRTDSGATQFIKRIDVEMGKGEPNRILVSPTEHLNTPPILECLNDNFDIASSQTGKSDWLFELSSPSYIVFESSPERKEWLFRLEIIR